MLAVLRQPTGPPGLMVNGWWAATTCRPKVSMSERHVHHSRAPAPSSLNSQQSIIDYLLSAKGAASYQSWLAAEDACKYMCPALKARFKVRN